MFLLNLVTDAVLWLSKKFVEHMQPFRVDYNEQMIRIEYLPWVQPVSALFLFILCPLALVIAGEFTAFFVSLFGCAPLVGLIFLLRRAGLTIVADKPRAWIRATTKGVFGSKTVAISAKKLKSITYEPAGQRDYYNVAVMTGAEGTTMIARRLDFDTSASIVGYLNGFFFDESGDVDMKEIDLEKPITIDDLPPPDLPES
jgi:hypothetical protein